MPLQFYKGKLLFVGGKLAMHSRCCCGGEVPACSQLCGCCYSDDAVMGTPPWPSITLGTADPLERASRLAALAAMVSHVNATIGAKSLAFAGGGFTLDLLSTTSDIITNEEDFGEVTWTWITFSLTVTCSVVEGVRYWYFSLRAIVDWLFDPGAYACDIEITGEVVGTCCGTAQEASTTWAIIKNVAQDATLGTATGLFTISNNKCCVDELGECTHTGSENCEDNEDDAACPEEGI